ncbi:MAG: hypothetical protein Q9198_001030, partial [Flavoplaca austrocitrina]
MNGTNGAGQNWIHSVNGTSTKASPRAIFGHDIALPAPTKETKGDSIAPSATTREINGSHVASEPSTKETNSKAFTPMAICGMACRLPGNISSPHDLWKFLAEGGDARSEVPLNRWNASAYYSATKKPGSSRTKHGYFLDESIDLGALDTSAFPIGRTELERLDPQQRLLLEVAHECLEDSGETRWQGSDIGVYVGCFGQDWYDVLNREGLKSNAYQILGSHDFMVSERISHELDLRGPSLTIRTACSSSMIGLNEACMAIAKGDCKAAIVGGTSLFLSPSTVTSLSDHGVFSPDGSSNTFSAKANGFARGEAIVAIYIKSLDEALRDGNSIQAVISGIATNFDGKTPNMSMPSAPAQEAAIRRAYQVAGIQDSEVWKTGLFECHGTGTAAGDPIETRALANVFGAHGLHLSSIKPNLGHSEGAAGVSAILKAVLALEHRTIPPSIKAWPVNPKIPFESGKLTLAKECIPWPAGRHERVSVNSFGIGGANAHAIIDSASSYGIVPAPARNGAHDVPSDLPHLFVYSAYSSKPLERMARNIERYLDATSESFTDVAYTLARRRQHLPHRSFVVSAEDKPGEAPLALTQEVDVAHTVVMVFTGQGAQWPQMGRDLIRSNRVFAKVLEDIDVELQRLGATWTVHDELRKTSRTTRVNEAEFSQPLCTAIQIALAEALASVGVEPAAVVGHSSGEVAAAYAAGALTLREAITVAYHRGFISKKQTKKGAMAAVGLGWTEAHNYLLPGVVVACDNSHNGVTLSGDADQLELVVSNIRKARPEVPTTTLKVERAYHSHHMVEVGEAYCEAMIASGVVGAQHSVPFFSSVTGQRLSSDVKQPQLGPRYWQKNLESPVRFKSAVVEILKESDISNPVFLEVGPHAALADPIRQILANESQKAPHAPTLTRRKGGTESFLTCIGKLWTLHVNVDFSALMPHGRTLSGLPCYPWDHQKSHWYEPRVSREWRMGGHPYHDLLGRRLPESTDLEPLWRNLVYLQNVPWISDHRIDSDIVFPFAAFVAMAAEAVRQISEVQDTVEMRNVTVSNALPISDESPTELVTSFRRSRLTDSLDSDWWDFTITSHNGHIWTRHCTGQVRSDSDTPSNEVSSPPAPDTLTLPRKVDSRSWYEAVHRRRLSYGPHFMSLEDTTSSAVAPSKASARLRNNWHGDEDYHLHPVIVDAFFQLLSVASHNGLAHMYRRQVPTSIEHLTISRCQSEDLQVYLEGTLDHEGGASGQGLCIAGSKVVSRFSGVRMTLFEGADPTANNDIPLTARAEWVPHADFWNIETQFKPVSANSGEMTVLENLTRSAIRFSQQALSLGAKSDSPHLQKYGAWLSEQPITSPEDGKDLANSIQLIAQSLESTPLSYTAKAIATICSNIDSILSGERDIYDILATDGVLEKLLEYMSEYDRSEFFHNFAHFKPNLRILELGAGSGAATAKILPYLRHEKGQNLFSRYVVTDASMGLVNAAKERFKGVTNLEFACLSVEKDLADQDLEDEEFDLIISAGFLHTTTNVAKSLSNVRKLLSPKGRLLVQELAIGQTWAKFILGILPSWWSGDSDGRQDGPFMSREMWIEKLNSAGFTRADFVENLGQSTVIVAQPEREQVRSRKITLLYEQESIETVNVSRELEARGYAIDRCTMSDSPIAGQDIIALMDLDTPYLWDLTTTNLEAFQNSVKDLQGSGVLWITRPCQAGVKDPRFAPIIGLSRTMRSELAVSFATCETEELTSTANINALVNVVSNFHDRRHDGVLGPELEYAISDGTVLVNRFFPFDLSAEIQDIESTQLQEAELAISKAGQLGTLHWSARKPVAPQDGEVEVEVHVTGLNFRDILVAMGILKLAKTHFGYEAAGVVRKLGPNATKFSVGDRVVLMGCNTFATTVTQSELLCEKLPDSVSLLNGAGSPLCFTTAIYGLVDMGRLEEGQSVLIHSAAGGVGIAAIQVAKMLKATIYATVGSVEKQEYLTKFFGIPKENIFDSRSTTFVADLMRQTGGRGVDVALNSLSGELLHQTWKCVAKWGTMVEIGKRDLLGSAKLDMKQFADSRTYCCISMDQMTQERPKVIDRLLRRLMEHFRQGILQPIPLAHVSPASEIPETFKLMQQSKHIGKMVVELRNSQGELLISDVQALQKRPVALDSSAAYILVGGLGGLGQSISRYMVQQGARNLMFLSRSADRNDSRYRDFIHELEEMGSTVQCVKGNAARLADVERAIDGALAPAKGILNMTIALADEAFLRMTIEEWNTSVEPKIKGTWNILEATKSRGLEIDFLVLISSLSGIVGQTGQANYSSANTFLDAFSQYSTNQGLPCTTITSGVMEGIGVMSGSIDLLKKLQGSGWRLNNEAELIEIVDSAIQLTIAKRNMEKKQTPATTSIQEVNKTRFIFGLCPTVPLNSPDSYTNLRADVRMAVYHNSKRQSAKSAAPEDALRTLLTTAKKDPSVLESSESVTTLALDIGKKLCSLLLLPDDNLSPSMKTGEMGLDSMVAVEMCAWWKLTLGLQMSMLEMVSM